MIFKWFFIYEWMIGDILFNFVRGIRVLNVNFLLCKGINRIVNL